MGKDRRSMMHVVLHMWNLEVDKAQSKFIFNMTPRKTMATEGTSWKEEGLDSWRNEKALGCLWAKHSVHMYGNAVLNAATVCNQHTCIKSVTRIHGHG